MAIWLAVFSGCSTGSGASEGHVRFSDGQPVRSGSIEFRSLDSGDRYSSRIDEQGRFRLLGQDDRPAVPAGQYEVVVVQMVLTEDLASEKHTHGRTVPRRYADYSTSNLRVVVREDAGTPIEVTLEGE